METSVGYLGGRWMYVCQSPDGEVFNTKILDNQKFACALLIRENDEYWACSWIESKEHAFYTSELRRQGGFETMVVEIECIEFSSVKEKDNAQDSKDNLYKRGSRRSFESTL